MRAIHFKCVEGDWDKEFGSVILSKPYKNINEVFKEDIINFDDFNIVDGTILRLGFGYDEDSKSVKYFIVNGDEIDD